MAEQNVELGIQATVMAIRERLMEYYKGTCVERFTQDTNISLVEQSRPSLRYQYQREEFHRRASATVKLGDLPLLVIQRSPEKITFYQKIFERSPQLRQVYEELILFVDKYLGAVEVIHDQKGVFYANE